MIEFHQHLFFPVMDTDTFFRRTLKDLCRKKGQRSYRWRCPCRRCREITQELLHIAISQGVSIISLTEVGMRYPSMLCPETEF